MCGIVGYVNFDERALCSEETHAALLNALYHRGPDEPGAWQGKNVFLGMRRLSIIDLTSGQQPIWNEDQSSCIVYNGELYNYLDLRPLLEKKGHIFQTQSDTEVILHAYEEWGYDCLRRFNGMFAFAIWNKTTRTLFLARDRIGEKPLYYYKGAQRLLFASEIKAILADATVPRDIHWPGVSNFFAFGHAIAPDTIYQNISKLLPGHYLVACREHLKIVPYWDVGTESQLSPDVSLREDEYAARIVDLLDDSVRRRIIADVPVGAFLSGGVDSSVVVALMQRHASPPVKTFSLGFSIGRAYNELADARRVAEYFHTEHHELHIEHTDLIQTLRTLVYHYDEPFGDAASFPLYLLSRFAREHVKVVLSGDGGDELFGGYRRYAADQWASLYHRLPHVVTNHLIGGLVQRFNRLRRLKRATQTLPISNPPDRYASWLLVFTPEMQRELLQPERYRTVADHEPARMYPFYYQTPSASKLDHLNRLMYLDLKTWLVDGYMEKTDKATMACSLEARLPLLDHRLVELAFQIPSRYKIRGFSMKRIFKKAVTGLVPDFVLRKPKHGFAVPTDPWFRGELSNFSFQILFDDQTTRRGYFNLPFVEKLWCEHQQGRHVWDTHLWLLLNFELWHRIYIDGEGV